MARRLSHALVWVCAALLALLNVHASDTLALANVLCKPNAVSVLYVGEESVCMGALLGDGRFTLTTGNCGTKMEAQYSKYGDLGSSVSTKRNQHKPVGPSRSGIAPSKRLPRTAHGDRSANVGCVKAYSHLRAGSDDNPDIALVQAVRPLDENRSAFHDVPSRGAAVGDKCHISFAPSTGLEPLGVAVKSLGSGCAGPDVTKLCVAVEAAAGGRPPPPPALPRPAAEGAALVCGGALQGLLAAADEWQGELAAINVVVFDYWVLANANVTAAAAGSACPGEDDDPLPTEPSTQSPTSPEPSTETPAPTIVDMPTQQPLTTRGPAPTTEDMFTTLGPATPLTTHDPGQPAAPAAPAAGGSPHRAGDPDLALGLLVPVLILSSYR